MTPMKTYQELIDENKSLRSQLDEAAETLHAIRTGQIDALVVEGNNGHELYTLKTADHTYRIFIETMNEGAVTLNENGLILYSNTMFARMVGQPLSAVLGVPFTGFVDSDSLADYQLLFSQGWNEERKVELNIITLHHQKIPCMLSVKSLDLDEGLSLSIILTDLTVQKETQQLLRINNEKLEATNSALRLSNQALNRSNDNLQEFAYVASHDLQEPLRKIQQFGDILNQQYGELLGRQGQDMLVRMQSAAARMSTLIRDLLNFSRLTTPGQHMNEQNLNDLVAGVLVVLDLSIQEKQASVEVGDLGCIAGDATQLTQLFQNLLTNALKFTRPDVKPRVRVNRQPIAHAELPPAFQLADPALSYCAIQVRDNGIGFQPSQAEQIFGTFQRLHGRSEYPGTGIGLAIVRKVVENHHGYVHAESQPGQGATFTIYLPE